MNLEPAILDLIIERATYGLSLSDQDNLDRLIQSSPDPAAVLKESLQLELSIAALELSQQKNTPSPEGSISPALQAQIRLQATESIETCGASGNPLHDLILSKATPRSEPLTDVRPISRRRPLKEIFVWTVAAVSLLTLALFIRQSPDVDHILTKRPTIEEFEPSIDLVQDILPTDEQMKRFLSSTPEDLLSLSWTPVDSKNVTGNVFWSDQRQTGFMTFQGLEINNPLEKQYQVWIYDTDTKAPEPVTGGVFDVSKTGHHVVPIAPVSPVKKAVQFAITAEQPGGVKVSQQKHVPTVTSQPF